MIKLLLTNVTLITVCAVSQAHAQIQTMNPTPGDIFTYEYFDLTAADSGSVGMNQTWDFSDATTLDETLTKTFRALTTQEQNDYPQANLAYTEDSDPTVYLMNASADSLVDLGETDFMFTNPMVLYKYPIGSTYNFTDNSGITGVPMFTFNGTMQTFSQGSGTLITPFGTYNNVMKIRRNGVINYTLAGSPEQVLVDAYVWINADNQTELLTIESSDYVNNTETDETSAFFLRNGAFASVHKISGDVFSLYPNPAHDVVYLKSAVETPVTYKVYSVAGVEVQIGKYVAGQGVSTAGLQVGEYILQIETESGSVGYVKFAKV